MDETTGTGATRTLEVAHERVCGPEVHDALLRTQVLGMVTSLRLSAGDAFVTAVTGADSLTMNEWCEGWVIVPRDAEERLQIVDTLFATFDDHGVSHSRALAWFSTANDAIGGLTPAEALRTRPPTDVAPALLVAARVSVA
jgi:hypothetical protein